MAHDKQTPPGTDGEVVQNPRDRILRAGDTCWKFARADQVEVLCDNEEYFAAAAEAIAAAKRSVLLLAWCFDPRTPLRPGSDQEERIGPVLKAAARDNPNLLVRIVCWDMSWILAMARAFFPQRAKIWFRNSRCTFILKKAQSGACHHQKLLVVDDTLAFCSGGDFLPNRWDSTAHLDDDRRRRQPTGGRSPPRHDVTMSLRGPVAAELGRLARGSIRNATGEEVPVPGGETADRPFSPVPRGGEFGEATLGIVRAAPSSAGQPAVRETLKLWMASIAAAKHTIYIENQYFASPLVTEALAERLEDPNGPEVIVVCPRRAPSWLDELFMGSARDALVLQLQARDLFKRLRVYRPRTQGGQEIVVHSKLAIIDDAFFRIGSANINNRSFGVDTECDLAFEAAGQSCPDASRRSIRRLLHRSIGHLLGCAVSDVSREHAARGSLAAAIEALDPLEARLQPLRPKAPEGLRKFVARYEIGNPYGTEDIWKPWMRPRIRHQTCRTWLPLVAAYQK